MLSFFPECVLEINILNIIGFSFFFKHEFKNLIVMEYKGEFIFMSSQEKKKH